MTYFMKIMHEGKDLTNWNPIGQNAITAESSFMSCVERKAAQLPERLVSLIEREKGITNALQAFSVVEQGLRKEASAKVGFLTFQIKHT